MFKSLILLSLAAFAFAQPDPSLGTFQCYTCGNPDCYLSSNNNIFVSGFGNKKCTDLQGLADDRSLFPDECADIQAKTLASSDPCNCRHNNGGACPEISTGSTPSCNLCGSGNQFLGDPERIIATGTLSGSKCSEVFEYNKHGAFASTCPAASAAVRQYCQCRSPGQETNPCIPVEDNNRPCDPFDASDTCCAGSCKYLNRFGGFRCTTRRGDTPPANFAPPPSNNFVACFSGENQVVTQEKGAIAMKDLEIGDQVLVADNKFDTVYSFGHRSESAEATYLSITSDKSSAPLELTSDHMVFRTQGHAVPAAALKKGDTMLLPSGELATIMKIASVVRTGVYAPFTYSGALVVNGVVASSFIAMQETNEHWHFGDVDSTLTFQWLAHAFEAPHRMAYRLGLINGDAQSDGVSPWVALPLAASKWLVAQSATVQTLIAVPAIAVMGTFWCLEQHLVLVAAAAAVLLMARRSKKAL